MKDPRWIFYINRDKTRSARKTEIQKIVFGKMEK